MTVDIHRSWAATAPVHLLRDDCRGCGGTALSRILALGETALANAFLGNDAEFATEQRFALDVYLCQSCGLVQLLDVIDPETLFRNYVYVTGTSTTMAAHNKAYAASVTERLGLGQDDLVVEIASNDGSLLRYFNSHGVRTLGVEPARNIARIARDAGIATVEEFFTSALAHELRDIHGSARAVIANNVLAHVDDTRGFLSGARALLAPDGLLVVEVPWLGKLVANLEYDTVYHEHLCYFSLTALSQICSAAGLHVVDVEHVSVHGGSLRVYASPVPRESSAASVTNLLAEEAAAGLRDPARLARFADDVSRQRSELRALLESLQSEGKTIAGYGAPAKGNTLLQYCNITSSMLPYTVDRNPFKVDCFTPGTHIPVLPVDTLAERRPDYLLILAWNFAEEIMAQQAEYRASGGRFIVPLPVPRII
ncbi:MAG: class I SAM-dependent methyltransferase [Gemmatimonadaceae bacterium]